MLLNCTIFSQGVQTVTIVNGASGFCPGNTITVNFTVSGTPANRYRVRLVERKYATSLESTCPVVVPRLNYDDRLLDSPTTSLSHTLTLPAVMHEIGYSWVTSELNSQISSEDPCKIVDFEVETIGYIIEIEPVPNFSNLPVRTSNLLINNCTATPLPVDFLYFNSKERSDEIELNWATSSEKNNAFFEVEHALNSANFKVIGKINGNNNSNEIRDYHFTHFAPKSGVNYYRLKQIDFNGKISYSKIISHEWATINEAAIKIFPNPIQDFASVNLQNKLNARLTIYRLDGKLIKSFSVSGNTDQVDFTFLKPGMYLIATQNKNGSVFQKILKK